MGAVRRSGRIAKEVPLVLLGTDTSGKVFSERTKTVVLSRHGAGIVSRHRFAPEEVLTLRLPESGQEAEVRLVGKMGDTPRGHIYGVEFLKTGTNYWGIEFPPPEDYAPSVRKVALECILCQEREEVQQGEIETDVYLATEGVFRYCRKCEQTTTWKKATEQRKASSPCMQERELQTPPGLAEAPGPPAGETGLGPQLSASSRTATVLEAAPAKTQTRQATGAGVPRRENRRRHVRTRVSFTACVRRMGSEEDLVECENVSKGGLCFRSRKKYFEGSLIEVAAPYSPGEAAIFVFAVIKRVEELQGASLYRYGVAYENPSAPR